MSAVLPLDELDDEPLAELDDELVEELDGVAEEGEVPEVSVLDLPSLAAGELEPLLLDPVSAALAFFLDSDG